MHCTRVFIEKVTVFHGLVKYADGDLVVPTDSMDGTLKNYKLAALYDRDFEYAETLAAQGLVKEAAKYLKWTLEAYTGSALDCDSARAAAGFLWTSASELCLELSSRYHF